MCNTFVGCVNGTMIYDYPNDRLVSMETLTGDIFTPLTKIYAQFHELIKNVTVFNGDSDTVIEGDAVDFEQQLQNALKKPVLKVIIRAKRLYEDGELEIIRRILGDEFEQARSWSIGLEIQNKGKNKGKAAKRIAELAGAKTLICVGDYENDLSLLAAADISYAVDNALPSVKAIAHRQTVSVENGAIAAIIQEL